MTIIRSVSREGDQAIIKVSMEDVHDLRVALEPCTCRGARPNLSNATKDIRADLCTALGRLEALKR